MDTLQQSTCQLLFYILFMLYISGQVSGAILAYSTSGVLCANAPDNGWPFIFYVHGKKFTNSRLQNRNPLSTQDIDS